jgi:hypothetical protein
MLQFVDHLQPARNTGRRMIGVTAGAIMLTAALTVFTSMPDFAGDPVPALGRVLLGLGGIVASVALWTGRRLGLSAWQACRIWALLQIPFVAWTQTGGSPTEQFLVIPVTVTEMRTVNGEVTSFVAYGVNLAGIAFAWWLSARRADLEQ